ncbi:GNAT family N-acetyltransferase [Propionibacteriaceae bacterium G1746]
MSDIDATVRAATQDDLATIRTFPHGDEVDVIFAATQVGEAIIAVVEADKQVIASAVLDLISPLRPEVKRIWVSESSRRRGLGTAMTMWLEQQARQLGFDATQMAIDPQNEKAIPMAIDLGYSATGDHLFIDQPDPFQVEDPEEASDFFAIYRKSLTMN